MKLFFLSGLLFYSQLTVGQELFVHTEPASTLPKGVIAARIGYEYYSEPRGRPKYWTGLRLMYGAGRKLTVMGSLSASNHHIKVFPGNLLQYFKNHHSSSHPAFPFLFEGLNFYAKYRFMSIDRPQKHLRLAAYAQVSKVMGVHDVAEPNLMGDNSGVGAGLIVTHLNKRGALSLTSGIVSPFQYKDAIVKFKSGNAWQTILSAGYRLKPVTYTSYSDLNVNLYMELIHTAYTSAKLSVDNEPWNLEVFKTYDYYTFQTLTGGQYVELRPSIQFIINSSTRIDFSTGFNLYQKTYLKYNPSLFINYQKNFYPGKFTGKKL